MRNLQYCILEEARKYIGKASYCLKAHSDDAPDVFNCSSFVQYIFKICSFNIPRRAYQQKEHGTSVKDIIVGDLVFASGKNGWNPSSPVGHVGISTGTGNIIHATATDRRKGVVEDSLDVFLERRRYLGACRILSKKAERY